MNLEIGMYFKRYDGKIFQIDDKDTLESIKHQLKKDDKYVLDVKEELIDLVKEGDLVNGHKVIYKNDELIQVDCGGWIEADSKGWLHYENYEEDIKSIVTKEWIEQGTFKVGE